jgi:hypothetical protein
MEAMIWLRGLFPLLAGSSWNNARIAGLGYLNSNNTASKSNRNIGTHLELMTPSWVVLNNSSPELELVKHTTGHQRY